MTCRRVIVRYAVVIETNRTQASLALAVSRRSEESCDYLSALLAVAIMLLMLVGRVRSLGSAAPGDAQVSPGAVVLSDTPGKHGRRIADTFFRGAMRQHFLSWFGPFSLFGLFASWAVALIFAFALLQWAVGAPLGSANEPPVSRSACTSAAKRFSRWAMATLHPQAGSDDS